MEVRSQPGAAGTILNNLVALGVGEIHAVGFCGDDGEGYELRRALAAQPGVKLIISSPRPRGDPVYCKPLVIEPGRATSRAQPARLQELDANADDAPARTGEPGHRTGKAGRRTSVARSGRAARNRRRDRSA